MLLYQACLFRAQASVLVYCPQTLPVAVQLSRVNLATSNFYTRSQVDSSLSLKEDKTNVINNYYNKLSIDNKVATLNASIGLKANSSDVYTKAHVDTALLSKANNSQLSSYYTKTEPDERITFATAISIDLGNFYDKANIDSKIAT